VIPRSSTGSDAVGWEALRRGDWAEAGQAFERTLAGGESGQALDGLAQAAWWLSQTQAAISNWERAYTAYRREGDDADAAQVALRLCEEYEKTLALGAAANGWLARAQDLLTGLEPGRAQGMLLVAQAERAHDPQMSLAYAQEAVQLARLIADPDLELVAMGKIGLAEISLGRVEEGVTHFDEAMAAASSGEPNELRTLGDLYCALFLAMEVIQDSGRFEQWTEIVMGFMQGHNHPDLLTFCGTCCAELFAVAGQWEDMERQLLDTLRALEANGQRARCIHPSIRLAALRIAQGRLEEAESLMSGYEDLAEATQPMVSLYLARGEPSLAAARLHRRLNQTGRENLVAVPLLAQLVEVQVAQSDIRSAGETAAQLMAIADTSESQRVLAAAVLAQGLVESAAARPDAATHFGRAVELYAGLRMPHAAARAHLSLARMLVVADRKAAIREATAAFKTFEQLGAARDADEAAGLLRNLGVGGRTGPKGWRGLSRREGEVLRLLADGLTNAEIASRLFIGTKTVDTHVGNILSKLGVRNRGGAAAWAHRNIAEPMGHSAQSRARRPGGGRGRA